MTSNNIHIASLANSQNSLEPYGTPITLLPDLTTQIQSFMALPPSTSPEKETLFIISLGFWDIYNFASLDYTLAQNTTDTSINELFSQLGILYSHHVASLPSTPTQPTDNTNITSAPTFQIIIPKVLDPSLLPGWLSHRPFPLKPSSIAEQQKNAAYLTARWNQGVENRLGMWMKSPSEKAASKPNDVHRVNGTETSQNEQEEILKDVFYYDLPGYLLDTIIEHQLEDEGLSDASGLGTGESPFESVYRPCVCEPQEDEDVDGLLELGNGMIICGEPEEYLWWDAFGIGGKAKEFVGKEIAGMVEEGRSERERIGMGMRSGGRGGGV
jgi:hypothetical protein